MTDPRGRFHPSEVDLDVGYESAALLEIARDLEAYAEMSVAAPTIGFEDKVMAAIAAEPMPRPSARHGLIALVRDSWASAFGPGRPLAVRAQAFALLLVFAVAIGSVGTLVGVGASRLLLPDGPPAPVVPTPSPSPLPSPTEPPSLPPSPSPTPSATPTESSSPTETPSPTETDEPTGTDNSGPGGGGGGNSGSGSEDSGRGSDGSGGGSGSGSGSSD